MKFSYLVVSALALSSLSALAEQKGFDKEKAYQTLCVPGSALEKSLSNKPEKVAELRKTRASIQAFLKNPEPTVRELEASFAKRDQMDLLQQAGLALAHVFTCGIAEALGPEIEARGCRSDQGEKISAKKANELCAPLNALVKAEFEKAQENSEGEKEPE